MGQILRKIALIWSVEDIIERAAQRHIELTVKQASKILSYISDTHDASVGVNWEVIDIRTDEWLSDPTYNT